MLRGKPQTSIVPWNNTAASLWSQGRAQVTAFRPRDKPERFARQPFDKEAWSRAKILKAHWREVMAREIQVEKQVSPV